jgi:uncharacterized delta-60 repeat protein
VAGSRKARRTAVSVGALVLSLALLSVAFPALAPGAEPERSLKWATKHHAEFDAPAVPGNDAPILSRDAIATAQDGSVYTTGHVAGVNDDILTVAYNPDGTLKWRRLYDNGGRDRGLAIAMLPSGDAAVLGSSSNGTNDDLVTIVYGADGSERWVRRYDGGVEGPSAIEVAADGDVVVAGQSSPVGGTRDIVIARYGPNGEERWAERYDGGADEEPNDIALTPGGGVIATGEVSDGSWGDYLTVAFDSAGDLRWDEQWDNADKGDRAWGVAVDSAGNSYITGYSDNGRTAFGDDDAVTISYDPTGTLRWMSAYDGAPQAHGFAIAIAPDGAVIVGGQVYNGQESQNDFLALSYKPDGTQRWARVYDAGQAHPGFGDLGHGVHVDDQGNVYVTGPSANKKTWYLQNPYDAAVVSWDATGERRWVIRYDSSEWDRIESIDVDDAGNVYLAAETLLGASADMRTIKYGPGGDKLWASKEPPLLPGGDDLPGSGDVVRGNDSLAVDRQGNTYVVGRIATPNGDAMQLVKHDEDGVEEWTAMYDGGLTDRPYAVAVDRNGNSYVIGDIYVDAYPEPHWDFMTLSFDPKGEMRWSSRFSEFFEDRAGALAVTPDGEVYVTGKAANGDNFDIVTVKYDDKGSRLWEKTWDGTLDDVPVAISLDDAGNAYVVGSANGGHFTLEGETSDLPLPRDVVTIKYAADGTEEWVRTHIGPLDDVAVDAVAQPDGGGVYVGANSVGPGGRDTVTLWYPASGGAPSILSRDEGPEETIADLALAPDGDVYTVVTALGEGLEDFVVTRSGPDATVRWNHRVDRATRDHARAATVDALGNLTVAGTAQSPEAGGASDYLTVTLAPDGTEIWSATHDEGDVDEAIAIGTDRKGGIVVTGSTTGMDFLTVAYSGSIPDPDPSPSPSPSPSPTPQTTNLEITSLTFGQYSDPIGLEALLTGADGDPISGQELEFELRGWRVRKVFTTDTDERGVGSVASKVPLRPGPYILAVFFEGTDAHKPTSNSAEIRVAREDAVMKLGFDNRGRVLVARLTDRDSRAGVARRSIAVFADGKRIGRAVTNSVGKVRIKVPVRYRRGKHAFKAVFAGDEYYRSSAGRARG